MTKSYWMYVTMEQLLAHKHILQMPRLYTITTRDRSQSINFVSLFVWVSWQAFLFHQNWQIQINCSLHWKFCNPLKHFLRPLYLQHNSGYYGHYRSRVRNDFMNEYRQRAKPQPPQKYIDRSRVCFNTAQFCGDCKYERQWVNLQHLSPLKFMIWYGKCIKDTFWPVWGPLII